MHNLRQQVSTSLIVGAPAGIIIVIIPHTKYNFIEKTNKVCSAETVLA